MTREEAIEILKNPNEMYQGSDGVVGYTFNPNRKNYEAFQLAIKALEQEPCEDAVSRQAVLNTLDFTDKFLDETRTVETYKGLLTACYKDLPSVTLTHKQNWIPCSERLPNESGKYWCTFSGTNLMGIDFYTTESYAKKWFDEPEEYIGWESKNVSAWMPLPEPYKENEE